MNGAAYEASATDYHDYALVSSSVYKAGNTRQASDGSDVGANLAAITPLCGAAKTRASHPAGPDHIRIEGTEPMSATADIALLQRLGEVLDSRPTASGRSRLSRVNHANFQPDLRDLLIGSLLKVRSKTRGLVLLRPNRAQRAYALNCTKRNVVLKARQLGMTTYIAARFFVQTITQPGTLSVQVAHTQESAEEIFKIVRRFWENLPEAMQKGALVTSRANIRQLVFPRLDSEYRVATAADPNAGRGMTIHNLHCSDVARWPRDAAEVLASLRAAVPEDGEIVLESTPNGAGGVFYEEWQRAEETGARSTSSRGGTTRAYRIDDAVASPLTDEEMKMAERENTLCKLENRMAAEQPVTTENWRRRNRGGSEFLLSGLGGMRFRSGSDRAGFRESVCAADRKAETTAGWRYGFRRKQGRRYIVGVDPCRRWIRGRLCLRGSDRAADGNAVCGSCMGIPPLENWLCVLSRAEQNVTTVLCWWWNEITMDMAFWRTCGPQGCL